MSRKQKINIKTIKQLALRLGLPETFFIEVAENKDKHYRKHLRTIGDKQRLIYASDRQLKKIQKAIDKKLLSTIPFPDSIQGGIKGRSTLTHAQQHVNKTYVVNLDIKDFFPSVTHHRVYRMFIEHGCTSPVAELLTKLTTADEHLAQGFPTSTRLAALSLLNLDAKLKKYLGPRGMVHSVWVDDITISGNRMPAGLVGMVRRTLKSEGFTMNEKKSNVMPHSGRQEVTGLVVNSQPNQSKEVRKLVRSELHRLAKEELSPRETETLKGKINHLTSLSARNKHFEKEFLEATQQK